MDEQEGINKRNEIQNRNRIKKRRKRVERIKRMIKFTFSIAFIACFFILVKIALTEAKDEIINPLISDQNEAPVSTEQQNVEPKQTVPVTSNIDLKQAARVLYEQNSNLLVLVNKDHENTLEPNLKSICNGRLKASKDAYDDLCAMLEAGSDNGYSYWIASAYRSKEKQQNLIDQGVSKNRKKGMNKTEALEEVLKESMPAGYSEHETGLAFDILASSNTTMDQSQKNTKENKWMVKHCYEYGFILRYPKDKEDITKISYEPWHFRYVGRDAAKFIYENGLTLEEYYELLG